MHSTPFKNHTVLLHMHIHANEVIPVFFKLLQNINDGMRTILSYHNEIVSARLNKSY